MSGRKRRGETFAQLAASVPSAPVSTPEDFVSPVRTGTWVDGDGASWQRVGEPVAGARLRRLLRDLLIRAVLFADGEPVELDAGSRQALWDQIARLARSRGEGEHADFVAAEFRQADGGRLLVVEHRC